MKLTALPLSDSGQAAPGTGSFEMVRSFPQPFQCLPPGQCTAVYPLLSCGANIIIATQLWLGSRGWWGTHTHWGEVCFALRPFWIVVFEPVGGSSS